MKFKVNGIKWDCDGEDPARYNLPTDTEIEAEDEECVADALSDKYGWCIEGMAEIEACGKNTL